MFFGIADVGAPWWDNLGKGLPLSGDWREMALELEPGAYSDSPTIWSGTVSFSRRSWESMRDTVSLYGEAFELHGPAGDYVLFNPLDRRLVLSKQSEVMRTEAGRLMHIRKPVLRQDSAEELVIGKLNESPAIDVFVGQAFVDAWVKGGFVGLAFEAVSTSRE